MTAKDVRKYPDSVHHVSSTTYITPEGARNLHHYKYAGEDKSLIYKHILTPMNKWLIEFFPMWMAPNVITLSGLGFVMLGHIFMAYYCPQLEGLAPGWVYAVNGIFLLMYQTLDNLDGRQARRTGAASPLGLFFDHGCDAFNCTVGSLTMMSCVQLGPSWKALTLFTTTIFVFYLNTWEEYYTGELILPIVNGPTEGLILGALTYFWTAYVGADWWLNEIPVPRSICELVQGLDLWSAKYIPAYKSWTPELERTGFVGVKYNTLLLGFIVIGALVTLVGNIINVYFAIKKSGPEGHGRHSDTWLVKNFPFVHALIRLVPFVITVWLSVVWVSFSPSRIFRLHPRLIMWTIGLLFSKLVTHMMLAHVCSVEYHPFRRTLIPFFYYGGHCAILYLTNQNRDTIGTFFDEEVVVYEFFALALFTYLHLVYGVIKEMTAVLGIRCFHVPKPAID